MAGAPHPKNTGLQIKSKELKQRRRLARAKELAQRAEKPLVPCGSPPQGFHRCKWGGRLRETLDFPQKGRKQGWIIDIWRLKKYGTFSQFSHLVISDSLPPHESQHDGPPCPSSTPGVYPNSCPLSRWCHSAISSSVIPFSSCPQSLPASRSFPTSQLFAWGGQSMELSASASILGINTQDWFPLG